MHLNTTKLIYKWRFFQFFKQSKLAGGRFITRKGKFVRKNKRRTARLTLNIARRRPRKFWFTNQSRSVFIFGSRKNKEKKWQEYEQCKIRNIRYLIELEKKRDLFSKLKDIIRSKAFMIIRRKVAFSLENKEKAGIISKKDNNVVNEIIMRRKYRIDQLVKKNVNLHLASKTRLKRDFILTERELEPFIKEILDDEEFIPDDEKEKRLTNFELFEILGIGPTKERPRVSRYRFAKALYEQGILDNIITLKKKDE